MTNSFLPEYDYFSSYEPQFLQFDPYRQLDFNLDVISRAANEPFSSTGVPMSELSGPPHFNAFLLNVGKNAGHPNMFYGFRVCLEAAFLLGYNAANGYNSGFLLK